MMTVFALVSFGLTALAAEPQQAVITNTRIATAPGETVTTTLVLEAGSEASSFDLFLIYDPECLTLVSATQNAACSGSLIVNTSASGKIFVAFAGSGNITTEMPFLDVTFAVDENIGAGSNIMFEIDGTEHSEAYTFVGNSDQSLSLVGSFVDYIICEVGDVSLDGRIASVDATYILRYLVHLTELSDVQRVNADAYADGQIRSNDATQILRKVAHYDVQLGNRVNVVFHKQDGSVYVRKSVAFGQDLMRIPAVPAEEGYKNGRWSTSSSEHIEPFYTGIEAELHLYPSYEAEESDAMRFYKEQLTERYYSGSEHILSPTNLNLIASLTYQGSQHAAISWFTDKGAIINSTTGQISQPNYDTEVLLTARIIAYDGDAIKGNDTISFVYTADGKYQTPSKAQIATYLQHIFGTSIDYKIDYNILLPQKVTNKEVPQTDPYEVRVSWQLVNMDGSVESAVQLERTTTSQTVNLVATITFNGEPLEDDGKVYFDGVTLTAITETEIRHSIIEQIAVNMGLTLSTGDVLWDDDQEYNAHVQWISKNTTVANIAANTVTVRESTVNGTSFPMEAQVTYLSDDGAKTFGISYTTSVVNENTLLVPGINIQQALYDAFRDALDIRGSLTVEHLKNPTFVYLDLSEYPEITDLTSLTYCKNLRVLNISGLRIERAVNEICTLNNLEAFIARDCGLDNLTDGGIPVLKTAINLKLLDLSHNNFTSLDSVLAENVRYAKLQEVYLNSNQLTDISALHRAPILNFLALSDNGLESDDLSSVAEFNHLRYLSLSENNITSIAPLKNLKGLYELRLQNNQITDVKDLQLLVNLQALYLGNNDISLVDWLNNLRQLRVLYLNNNRVDSVSALSALTKLVALNVSGNNLSNLTMLSGSRETMKELYAEDNQIRSFSFLAGMTNLKRLMLAGNATDTYEPVLNANLSTLTGLQTLTLSGKKLTDGLGFLDNMTGLTRLDVANCSLPDGSQTHLPSTLVYLEISDNNIVCDPAAQNGLYNLDHLQGLYADNMQGLSDPDKVFNLMSELKYVSLENCGVTGTSWLSRFTDLEYVDLANNPLGNVNLDSLSTGFKNSIKTLLIDTTIDAGFGDAYYAFSGIGDSPIEYASFEGFQIASMSKLPSMEHVLYLNLSNTGITNLEGENPDLVELYSIARYETVDTLDLSGLQADIAPIEGLGNLHTLYVVGIGSNKIFYQSNIHALQRLYNSGKTIYLYDTSNTYEPIASKEGTVILGELPDISMTAEAPLVVAADNVFADDNPALVATVNDFPITWSVSNPTNYAVQNGKLSVKSYDNIVDEELTVTAQITVYPDQAPVTREFKINTHILRASEEYITHIQPGASYVRGADFEYDVTVHSAETVGFSQPVKPVCSAITYSYTGSQPWTQILTESAHRYTVNSDAILGAWASIIVAIGHNDPVAGFVTDWSNPDTTVTVVERTFKLTYHLNGGAAQGIEDAQPVPYVEESVCGDVVPTRAGYQFQGWFTDAACTNAFTAGRMPSSDLDLYAKWKEHSYTVTFDANGGSVDTTSKVIYCDGTYGTLPTPTLEYHDFAGWFTASNGGTQKTAATAANTTPTAETLYAHWTRRTFTLGYDVNGGNAVSPASKTVDCGATYGTLPTPTRDYHNFLGWYTAASGGTAVTSSTNSTNSTSTVTIYAHWELKPVSGWVLASDQPSNSQVVDTKWSYTHTQTSNSSSIPSGYSYKSSSYGSWSDWSSWSNSSISQITDPFTGELIKQVRTQTIGATYKTQYHYYRWYRSGHSEAYTGSSVNGVSYPQYNEIWSDYEFAYYRSIIYQGENINGNPYWVRADNEYNNTCDRTFTRVVVVTPAYTQWSSRTRTVTYTYQKDNIETTSNPTGGDGVSNVVKYVQYRLK
jgi:uncharacterized repeat protein (TIGR02543 family)